MQPYQSDPPLKLVSPVTGRPLQADNGVLTGDDGAIYPVVNGVVDLLDSRLVDDIAKSEIDVFDTIPIENTCYFRPELFERILPLIEPGLTDGRCPSVCVEMGGGEGYFAKAVLDAIPKVESYVCDLSLRHLKNADPNLHRIRCDLRHPVFPPGQIGLAAFWVSSTYRLRPRLSSCFR